LVFAIYKRIPDAALQETVLFPRLGIRAAGG